MPTRTVHARVKWMRNVISLSTVYLYYRMNNKKKPHTYTHSKKYFELIRIYMANEGTSTGSNSRLSYQRFIFVWFDVFLSLFVSIITWKENIIVIAICAIHHHHHPFHEFQKFCHEMDRNYYDLFCHLRNSVSFNFLRFISPQVYMANRLVSCDTKKILLK